MGCLVRMIHAASNDTCAYRQGVSRVHWDGKGGAEGGGGGVVRVGGGRARSRQHKRS